MSYDVNRAVYLVLLRYVDQCVNAAVLWIGSPPFLCSNKHVQTSLLIPRSSTRSILADIFMMKEVLKDKVGIAAGATSPTKTCWGKREQRTGRSTATSRSRALCAATASLCASTQWCTQAASCKATQLSGRLPASGPPPACDEWACTGLPCVEPADCEDHSVMLPVSPWQLVIKCTVTG